MQFRYKVIDENMSLKEGTLEAIDIDTARRMILENSWQLITLKPKNALSSFLGKSYQGKVKYETISSFCSQMAMMVRSGANIVRGIEILQAQMVDKKFKSTLSILHSGVSRGDSLSVAMRDTQGAIPELLINLVSVGEESGNLDSVLVSMAEYYDRENYIQKKVSSAAIYPIMLTFVLIGLIIFFMNFMLPEITGMMMESKQSLPLATQIIINASEYFNNYGVYMGIGLILIILSLKKVFAIPKYRYYLDKFLLKVPVLGRNIKNVVISRFSRTLALFLHSSIPIVPILNSMEGVVGNEVARRAIVRIREQVINGETLAHSFGQEKFFDPMVVQMMSIGEETGRLEELMIEVANNYDKRVELGIARMVAMVEPIFTIIIGIFAGGIIIAIALPIFSMATNMQ